MNTIMQVLVILSAINYLGYASSWKFWVALFLGVFVYKAASVAAAFFMKGVNGALKRSQEPAPIEQ